MRDLSPLLDRTRTYTLMRRALRRARSDGEGAKGEGDSRAPRNAGLLYRAGKAALTAARIAEAGGDSPEAIILYAKALALRPDLGEARAALTRALQGMSAGP